MINLSQETEALARRLAMAHRMPVAALIPRALEEAARSPAIDSGAAPRRRMDIDEMLAVGSEIAAMPVLDPRPPHAIMDDLNAP
jgi:antitoxin VapB